MTAPSGSALWAPELFVVASMVGLEIALLLWIVPRRGGALPLARLVLAGAGLIGSAGVLVSLLSLILDPNLNSATIFFEAAGITMGFPPGLWMIAIIVYRDRRAEAGGWLWPGVIGGLAISGELLMGYVLAVLEGQTHSTLGWVGATLTSPWYLGSMAVAMAVLAAWISFPRPVRLGLVGLAAAGIAAVPIGTAPVAALLGMSAVMSITLAAVLSDLRRGPVSAEAGRWIGALGAGLVAGELLAVVALLPFGYALRTTLFGLGMSAIMVVEFVFLLHAGWSGPFAPGTGGPPTPFADAAGPSRSTAGRAPGPFEA